MRLTVSIVVYELNDELLYDCLASLSSAIDVAENHGVVTQAKVTIVDNAQNSRAISSIQSQVPLNCDYKRSPRNIGYGAAHNLVIDSADSDYHLVLNPDISFEPNTISDLISVLREHNDISLIGPAGLTAAGKNAYLCKRFPGIAALLLRGFAPRFIKRRFRSYLTMYECHDIYAQGKLSDVELLSGCCLIGCTDQFQSIGGFDESYFLYFEDFDLCLRLARLGRITCLTGTRIVHHGGDASKKGLKHIYLFCVSAFKFYRTHGWKII